MIELTLKLSAVVLGICAVYLLWVDARGDYTFAAVVVTISAAFLSYRFHIKGRMEQSDNGVASEEEPGK